MLQYIPNQLQSAPATPEPASAVSSESPSFSSFTDHNSLASYGPTQSGHRLAKPVIPDLDQQPSVFEFPNTDILESARSSQKKKSPLTQHPVIQL